MVDLFFTRELENVGSDSKRSVQSVSRGWRGIGALEVYSDIGHTRREGVYILTLFSGTGRVTCLNTTTGFLWKTVVVRLLSFP